MRNQTCCFTGHRDIPSHEFTTISKRTEQAIHALADRGIRYFGVGGALGYDTLAASILFQLRETNYKHIKVILVYPFEGYTSRWAPHQQEQHAKFPPKYDKIICVSQFPSRESYLKRNRHLVDHSAYCISYCTKNTGGTAYTLRYAKSQGLTIFNTASGDALL